LQPLNSQDISIYNKNYTGLPIDIQTERFWQDVAGDLIALNEILRQMNQMEFQTETAFNN
jgi:hypothetical protein